jgi:hypothetical protein
MMENFDNLNYISIKNFHSLKGYVKSMKREHTNWENIFEIDTFDKI